MHRNTGMMNGNRLPFPRTPLLHVWSISLLEAAIIGIPTEYSALHRWLILARVCYPSARPKYKLRRQSTEIGNSHVSQRSSTLKS
jgi:hypothetical protein